MNIDYHLPKFNGMGMLVFGQLVGAAATPPRAGHGVNGQFDGPADPTGFYTVAFSAVVHGVRISVYRCTQGYHISSHTLVPTPARMKLLHTCDPVTCLSGVRSLTG
jgi:hypothetical protein